MEINLNGVKVISKIPVGYNDITDCKGKIIGTFIHADKKLYCVEFGKNISGHSGGFKDMNTGNRIHGRDGYCWNIERNEFNLLNINKRL